MPARRLRIIGESGTRKPKMLKGRTEAPGIIRKPTLRNPGMSRETCEGMLAGSFRGSET